MKIKRKEFLSLKQGGMSVSEYRDKFIQLSRYAPREVEDDEKKHELFLEGFIRPLLGLCFVAEGLIGRSGIWLKLFV
jgi:hypothetical protein